MTYSLYKVRKPRMTKLGQGVGVRAHYPIRDISGVYTPEIYLTSLTPLSNCLYSIYSMYISGSQKISISLKRRDERFSN